MFIWSRKYRDQQVKKRIATEHEIKLIPIFLKTAHEQNLVGALIVIAIKYSPNFRTKGGS